MASDLASSAQVLKAVPLADKGAFVTKISYSPLLGGYAIVLNDGRAAFLVASSNNFDPNVSTERSTTASWPQKLMDDMNMADRHVDIFIRGHFSRFISFFKSRSSDVDRVVVI